MNKSAVIKIVLYILLVIILLAIMILGILKKGFLFPLDSPKEELYNEVYLEKDIHKLSVELVPTDITIKESPDANVHVIIYGKKARQDKFSLNLQGGNLKISEKTKFCLGFCFFNEEVIIYLPKSFMKNIDLKTTSGDITISQDLNSNLDISSVSGDVYIKGANKIKGKTTSGDIEIDKALETELKTTSGDITLGQSGNIYASSVSGDIDINDLIVSGSAKIKTTSGDVEIDKINDAYVETETTSGEVTINNNNRKSNNTLKIETVSGDITVK